MFFHSFPMTEECGRVLEFFFFEGDEGLDHLEPEMKVELVETKREKLFPKP
jgi:hypothetical protein